MVQQFYILIFLLGFSLCGSAQVGINTTTPKAQLDISIPDADKPSTIDGILIPRINTFPATNPGADQHGMLVFLNKQDNNFLPGFYFWNHQNTDWEPVSGAVSGFYSEITNSAPKNIDDAIYRNGNLRIGGTKNDEVKLAVTIDSLEKKVKTGLEIINANSANSRNTYSITATNESATDAIKYGIKNTVSAAGEGVHYGIWNRVSQNGNSTDESYGIYNSVGKTFGATKKHYGVYSEIGTTQGDGWVYGIFSKAFGDDADKIYAGYFVGRVGIGKTPADEYILPDKKGKTDQVLVLDKNGKMQWEYPNEKTYISTGSTITGDYTVPDNADTIRIYNNVSSLTIPDASLNEGRIIILINWYGNSRKTFNFLSGDEIYDVTVSETDPTITGIEGGQRMTIQSIKTRWILLDITN